MSRDYEEVMIIAGEASGDMHAAEMINHLRQKRPEMKAYGMGSNYMQDAGVELLVDAREISVMGLWEVVLKYRKLKQKLRFLQEEMLRRKPDLLILVDFVEFNLKLAEVAKTNGILVLFYVSPQIWAWRPGRIHKIGRKIDMMAVIFPFEVSYYKNAGIPVRYVGHPLIDQVNASAESGQPLELDTSGPVVAILPGSRRGEIERILPCMLDAAALLLQKHPAIEFLLPLAHTLSQEDLQPYLEGHGNLPLRIINGRSHDVIRASDAVMASSGTATLEIALMQVPMAIVYRMATLTYLLIRPLIRIDFAGLPNIVAGRGIVRELIQSNAKPEAICSEIDRILSDRAYQEQIRRDLQEVSEKLGVGGGSQRVADIADEMLDGRIISE